MKKRLVQLLAGFAWVLSASTAQAAMITFEYSATEATGTGGVLTGLFGYDDSVGDTNASPEEGFYPGAGFITGTISGGPQDGLTFNRNMNVQVLDDQNVGQFQEVFQINDFASGNFIVFQHLSPTAPVSPLDSDALASATLRDALGDLANWPNLQLVAVVDDSGAQVFYTLSSVKQTSNVPEPGTIALLAAGVVGLAYRRVRQRAS